MPNAGLHEAAGSHGTIQLRDGRALGYVEYGDPTGPGLLYFHGHPGSRLEAKFLAPAATQADVRLIGIDRPGMGLSTYQPRRRLLDWVEDVEQLADHRAIDRFSVVGFSGGGPYAAACAYRIPHRLNACGLVASVGHVGMTVAFLARWLPWIFTYAIRRSYSDDEHARRSLRWFARRWVEPDRQALSQPGITELIAAALAEAFRQGARGAAYEGTLFGRPRGFLLRDITHPAMHLWHGESDREVPIKVARAVAAELPACSATYHSSEGHISLIVNHADEIVGRLTVRPPARP
jgi:pimeloyl-ACP methyl ester carboxylesterase